MGQCPSFMQNRTGVQPSASLFIWVHLDGPRCTQIRTILSGAFPERESAHGSMPLIHAKPDRSSALSIFVYLGPSRWTQMHTDKNYSERCVSRARIRSWDNAPHSCKTGPEFSPQHLCLSGSICGSL